MTQLHFQAGSRSLHEMVLSHGAFGFSLGLTTTAASWWGRRSRSRARGRRHGALRPAPVGRGAWGLVGRT